MRIQLSILLAAASFFACGESAPDPFPDLAGKEGVEETASGLRYEVITEGSGPKPTSTDAVTVHYEGRLTDGTVFDSSYARGEPLTFRLNQVVPGWTEGLQLMPQGSTYMLYLPSELGYGERAKGLIPANSPLVFKVELLKINGR